MARTIPGLKEALLNLEKSARKIGLVINQGKTVYMHGGKGYNTASGLRNRELHV
jgi:hypothetical protein